LSWISFLILVAALIIEVTTVQAATTIIVTTTNDELNDDSDCSLREAIRAANTDSIVSGCDAGNGDDTIVLPTGIYTLTISGIGEDAALTGDLDITSDLTINGGEAGITVIDGNGLATGDRVFDITASGRATLKNVTIQNGNVGGGTNGGGIRNYGVLTPTNGILSDNVARSAGGLLNVGTATIISSTIKYNTASDDGGGIRNDATLTIINSVVFSNTAASGSGGGILNGNNATILNSTLSNNQANDFGGGVRNNYGPLSQGSTLNLNNVTITKNTADTDDDGFGSGGGVQSVSVSVVNIKNSIVAMNFGPVGSPDCSGTLNSQGYNLVQNVSNCNLSGDTAGNIIGLDAKLGPLQDNGSTTFTHALLFGSPAIDTGSPILPGSGEHACEALDQRGVTRPQNTFCDIGAFEFDGWDEIETKYLPLILK
jgi:CSLREA domain-containing protein